MSILWQSMTRETLRRSFSRYYKKNSLLYSLIYVYIHTPKVLHDSSSFLSRLVLLLWLFVSDISFLPPPGFFCCTPYSSLTLFTFLSGVALPLLHLVFSIFFPLLIFSLPPTFQLNLHFFLNYFCFRFPCVLVRGVHNISLVLRKTSSLLWTAWYAH